MRGIRLWRFLIFGYNASVGGLPQSIVRCSFRAADNCAIHVDDVEMGMTARLGTG
jgi:hypothetical protein